MRDRRVYCSSGDAEGFATGGTGRPQLAGRLLQLGRRFLPRAGRRGYCSGLDGGVSRLAARQLLMYSC